MEGNNVDIVQTEGSLRAWLEGDHTKLKIE